MKEYLEFRDALDFLFTKYKAIHEESLNTLNGSTIGIDI